MCQIIPGNKNKEKVDARIDVEEEATDVVEEKDPGWQAVLLPAQTIDQVVDGCGLVNVEEVCRQVADEEGHDDG